MTLKRAIVDLGINIYYMMDLKTDPLDSSGIERMNAEGRGEGRAASPSPGGRMVYETTLNIEKLMVFKRCDHFL